MHWIFRNFIFLGFTLSASFSFGEAMIREANMDCQMFGLLAEGVSDYRQCVANPSGDSIAIYNCACPGQTVFPLDYSNSQGEPHFHKVQAGRDFYYAPGFVAPQSYTAWNQMPYESQLGAAYQVREECRTQKKAQVNSGPLTFNCPQHFQMVADPEEGKGDTSTANANPTGGDEEKATRTIGSACDGKTKNDTMRKIRNDKSAAADIGRQVGFGCFAAAARAGRACESIFSGKSSGVFNNQMLLDLMQTAATVVPAFQQPKGVGEQCKSMSDVQLMMTGLHGAYMAACGGTRTMCTSACADDIQTVIDLEDTPLAPNQNANPQDCKRLALRSRLKAERDTCENRYGSYMQMGLQRTLNSGMLFAANRACAKQAQENDDEFKEFCEENPDSPVCGGADGGIAAADCNDPAQARTSPECICADDEQRRTNPICNPNGVNGVTAVGGFSPAAGGGSGLLGGDDLADLVGEQGFNGVDVNPNQSAVNANQTGGGTGGPNLSGGGFGGGIGGGGGGQPVGPYDTDILNGTSSGRGGGGYGGGGGAGRGSFNYGNNTGGDGKAGKGFDLSKFLPKGKGARGIAAADVKAKNGITGPMGPSIWEKISNRYKKVTPYMKP